MNKQTFINEVMEELKRLNVHDRYDRLKSKMQEIDDAFTSNDANDITSLLGSPKQYARKIANDKDQSEPQRVKRKVPEHTATDKPMFSESKFVHGTKKPVDDANTESAQDIIEAVFEEKETPKDNKDAHTHTHTNENKHSHCDHNTHCSSQFDAPYYKKWDINKLLAILLIILVISSFSCSPSRLMWGIFGGITFLFFGLFKVLGIIFVVYLIVKVFSKPNK